MLRMFNEFVYEFNYSNKASISLLILYTGHAFLLMAIILYSISIYIHAQ